MVDIEIRKATIDDLSAIRGFCSSLFVYEHGLGDKSLDLDWISGKDGEEYIRKAIINEDSCAFVAIGDSSVVGYIEGGVVDVENYRNVGKMGKLESFYISDRSRGNGIGEKLYGAFVEWAKSKEIRRLCVEVSFANEGAMRFYEKKGFRKYLAILETEI